MPVVPLSQRFGEVVRTKRLQAGLSQEHLAEQAELHSTYIGLIERGLRNPTLDTAARIARALNASLSELITTSEKGVPQRKGKQK